MAMRLHTHWSSDVFEYGGFRLRVQERLGVGAEPVNLAPMRPAPNRREVKVEDRSPDCAPNRFMRFGAQSGIHSTGWDHPALRCSAEDGLQLHAGYALLMMH